MKSKILNQSFTADAFALLVFLWYGRFGNGNLASKTISWNC